MRRVFGIILAILGATLGWSQSYNTIQIVSSPPSGGCQANYIKEVKSTGAQYSCQGGVWTLLLTTTDRLSATNSPTASLCVTVDPTTTTKFKFAACGSGGGGATVLDDLTDVVISGTLATGQTLVKGPSNWVNGPLDLADTDAVTGILPDGNIPTGMARDSEVATSYQPLDSDLTDIAALTPTLNKILKGNGTAWTLGDDNNTGGGSVTSVATTAPITGGTITATGTIACATCVTSAAALTANRVVLGGGSQATTVAAADTTTTHALFATAGAPAFRAIAGTDIPTLNQNTTGTALNITASLVGDVAGTTAATAIGTGKVTSTHVLDGTLVNADINASAAIDGTKLVAASASVAGAVTTGAQTLAGLKTFQDGINTGSTAGGTEYIDQATVCTDPATGNTGVCTIGGKLRIKDTGTATAAIPSSSLVATSTIAAIAANTVTCTTACTAIGMVTCGVAIPLDGTNTAAADCTGSTGYRVCTCY